MKFPVLSFQLSNRRRGASWAIVLGGIGLVVFILIIVIPLAMVFGLPFGNITKATGSGNTTAQAWATAYCPVDNALEGGKFDRQGKPVQTLQQFVAGKASYVSVAMDKDLTYPYGTPISIPELDQKYNGGKPIKFELVDTGGAFDGKGLTRIDIANDGSQGDYPAATDNWENMNVTLNLGNGQAPGSCPNVTVKLLTKSAIQKRGTGTPKAIILHYTADEHDLTTEYDYFNNAPVDVQYEVFHSGQIVQYEADNAIPAGALDYNQPTKDYGSGASTISIENQGSFESSNPSQQATPAQITANINLVSCLMAKYNISKNNTTILQTNRQAREPYNVISHKEADARSGGDGGVRGSRRSDPGDAFLNRVVSSLP